MSDSYPLLVERSISGPIILQLSNPNADAGSGVKWQMACSLGNSIAEMGLFSPATLAPDAYLGGQMTLRSTGTATGISIIADDLASATIKFYAGGNGATEKILQLESTGLTLGKGTISVPKTITAGGTTGDRTIDKIAGTVNIAAGGSSVTVTDSTVTTSSIVFAVIRTADATLTSIKNVVPGSGSFVITGNAVATAETSIGFFVVN